MLIMRDEILNIEMMVRFSVSLMKPHRYTFGL